MKRKLSVFIVPDSGQVRQFSISKPVIYSVLSGVLVYTLVTVFLSFGFLTMSVDSYRIDELTRENEFLTAKLGDFGESISALHLELAVLTEKEKAIRTIFELPEIDPQQRELGIGGPDMLPFEDEIVTSRVSAYQSEAEIDRLIALTNFEKQQFDFVYDALLSKKQDLDHTPSIVPASGYLTRGYGTKRDPFTGESKLHSGLDISNRVGTPVVASANGIVESVERQRGLGKMIVIDHGNGYKTVYGHLSDFKVKRGHSVHRGEIIGLMGNTGYSTGPHLHYEIWKNGAPVNPLNYVVSLASLN